MAKPQKVRPGQEVPVSGQYSGGGRKEVTLVKGERVPPTAKKGQQYILVDKTKHKGT